MQEIRLVAETTSTVVSSVSRRIRVVGSRVVALTFDDGPSDRTTTRVLAALRQQDAAATFFISGELAKAYPKLTRRIVAQGHSVGSHSLRHRILPRLPNAALAADLRAAKAALERVSGRRVRWCRPPYGSTSPRVKAAIKRAGMTQVLWSIDTLDWRASSSSQVVSRALRHVHDGSVVLMHDSGGQSSVTGNAVPRIISRLKANGFDVVSLDEMDALGYRVH